MVESTGDEQFDVLVILTDAELEARYIDRSDSHAFFAIRAKRLLRPAVKDYSDYYVPGRLKNKVSSLSVRRERVTRIPQDCKFSLKFAKGPVCQTSSFSNGLCP